MRGALTRVNIVLLKEQHKRFQEFAQRYHGSLSQFLRLAGENEINSQEDTNEFFIQPIIEQQEKIFQEIKKIDQQLKTNHVSQSGFIPRSNIKKIASEIEEILISTETALSVPDIGEYLSYTQHDIISGIEWLLDHGRMVRMKQNNAPSKYRITGDMNE